MTVAEATAAHDAKKQRYGIQTLQLGCSDTDIKNWTAKMSRMMDDEILSAMGYTTPLQAHTERF